MDIWNDSVYPNLVQMSKEDASYCGYLRKIKTLEPRYLEIMESLPENDREIVEAYIMYCEECGYRFAQLAYWYASRFEEK